MTHIPLRMCIACRRMQPADDMLRIVRSKSSDTAEPDPNKKKFGRGAYICKSMECIKKAEKKRGIERHLGAADASDIYRWAEEWI